MVRLGKTSSEALKVWILESKLFVYYTPGNLIALAKELRSAEKSRFLNVYKSRSGGCRELKLGEHGIIKDLPSGFSFLAEY